MCFEIVFEIRRVRGIAMIDEMRIVVVIVDRLVIDNSVICDIANAAPVLDFWNRRSVMNETDMTNVFIEPRRIRNCSRFSFPVTSEPMIAAWLLPSPGKNEQIGDTIIVARLGLINSLFLISSFPVPCFGIIVLDFIEWIIVEVPKSPVRSERSGWLISIFSEDIPRNPARAKIRIAFDLDAFSL